MILNNRCNSIIILFIANFLNQANANTFQDTKILADLGNATAQFNLGLMYEEGIEIPIDIDKAMKWYYKAAEQGNDEAQNRLGNYHFTFNDHESIKWHLKAARQGNTNSQYTLGIIYEDGLGTHRNHLEAIKWYLKAAKKGNADAQYNLGNLYSYGEGIDKNYSEAMTWYLKASAQEHTKAQQRIAFMYEFGEGVVKNHLEAINWYLRVAKKGKAQYTLASLYAKANDIQSKKRAYMWSNLAMYNGDSYAQDLLSSISNGMTKEAIEDAKIMSFRCLKSNYNNCD